MVYGDINNLDIFSLSLFKIMYGKELLDNEWIIIGLLCCCYSSFLFCNDKVFVLKVWYLLYFFINVRIFIFGYSVVERENNIRY